VDVNSATVLLTAQRDLLLEWRSHIISLLTQPLSGKDSGEEADGQEYVRALDTQGEVEQFLQAYTALLADRREAYKAERTALAAHENKFIKLRQTKAAARAAAIDIGLDDIAPLEAKPEHDVLRVELTVRRTALRGNSECKALKVCVFLPFSCK
jgi:E3 ubiquitin-protein ligase SHPRH